MNLNSWLAYAIQKEKGLKWKLQVADRLIWSGSTLVVLSTYTLIKQVFCCVLAILWPSTHKNKILLGLPLEQSTSYSCNQIRIQ